jgi:sortase A
MTAMRRVKTPEDLSIDELRHLLVEKRRKLRQQRLEHFRRSGRVVTLSSEIPPDSLAHLQTQENNEANQVGRTQTSLRRRIWDRGLLLIEILAVIGLIFLLFNGLEIINNLNVEFAQALEQPTLTPTPLISAVILPSGHTPPNSPGGAQPNEAEIPEHLRPLVQNIINIPIPTPGPEQAIRIQIPAIRVDAPIVQGDGWEQLKKGVGQHIGTANPGQSSNMVLTAHNDVFGEIFRDLDQLETGDQIIVHTAQRAYTYFVTDSEIVEPTRVEVMGPTPQSVVTLISCYPYLVDNLRIIIRGHLQKE